MGRTSDIEKKISLQHAHILELSQKIETLKAEIEKMMAKLSSQEGIISGKEARLLMLEQDIEELKEMNKIHTKEAMVPVYSPNDTKISDINKIEVEKKDMVHKKEEPPSSETCCIISALLCSAIMACWLFCSILQHL